MKIIKITYDHAKNTRNIAKHGISFDLVKEMAWSLAVIIEDSRKDYGERRFLAFGDIGGRLHVLVFTPREDAIHVISLRKANPREIRKTCPANPILNRLTRRILNGLKKCSFALVLPTKCLQKFSTLYW